jgi:uncharacterized protein
VGGLRIEVAASAEELDRAGWDRMTGSGDLYLSTRWLRLLEDLDVGRPLHLLGREPESGSLVAGLACYLLTASNTPSSFTRVDRFLARAPGVRRTGDAGQRALALLPTLTCGGRQIGLSKLLTSPREPERRPERVAAMLAAAEGLARDQGARSMASLYVAAEDEVLRHSLAAAGFCSVPSHDNHVLEVDWPDFDGYLARFDGHRRREIRRERRRLEEAGVRISAGPLAPKEVPALSGLEANLVRRHGSPRSREQLHETLGSIAERLEDSSLLLTARQEGRLMGFSLFLAWRDELYARHVGFDYDFQGKLPLYFALLFYEVAALAPARGVRRIHYGVASGEAKRSRGCRTVPEVAYVRALDPEAEKALAELLGSPG